MNRYTAAVTQTVIRTNREEDNLREAERVVRTAASAGAHRGHDPRRLGRSFISGSFISGLLGLGTVRSQV